MEEIIETEDLCSRQPEEEKHQPEPRCDSNRKWSIKVYYEDWGKEKNSPGKKLTQMTFEALLSSLPGVSALAHEGSQLEQPAPFFLLST